MKLIPAQIAILMRPGSPRRNLPFLFGFLAILVVLIAIFTVIFHGIMVWEGQAHSWLSGLYWVLVTMSTLGFGDITFQSDLGRFFSVIVVLSGMIFLLVLLPFTFIEFFYSPFVKAQQNARAPRLVPADWRDHVIVTHYDQVSATFIQRLQKYRIPYVLVVKSVEEGLRLHDLGIKVVVADLEEPEAFAQCGFDRAAMVAATGDDFINTSIVFTAREHSASSYIVATANSPDSVDVMELAGGNHIMRLGKILGSALARRTVASDAQSHVIGSFGLLRIAEAMVAGTPMVGKTLMECRLRELCGVIVLGLWQRGNFLSARPDSVFTADTILVLAGNEEQLAAYNEVFCIYHHINAPIVIIGGGRVGRSAAADFVTGGIDYRIVEERPDRIRDAEKYVLGSAADRATLERAGLDEAPAILITTNDDAVNIYLSIYCRKLRPDIQIVVRVNNESNVARLHSTGADVVMSYASMGSNILFNLLRRENTLLVAEGLNVFRMPPPIGSIGKSIKDSLVRTRTGCSIIALQRGEDQIVNPEPDEVIEAGDELILIGTLAAEDAYCDAFPSQ